MNKKLADVAALDKYKHVQVPNTIKPIFKFRQTNSLEVQELVKGIKVHKACEIPRISSYLLKLCFKQIIPQIVHMINLSIGTAIVPTHCKNAVITPVFKSGDLRAPGNYRPISSLPTTSRLIEKCVHIQLSEYLAHNNKLSERQFGFRSNLSTTKAMSTLLIDIYNNINNSLFTKLCYITP